ncbi:MAG: methyltransferase domain-containing protein [Verrucomicrobiia bacterium]|jgi:hypothetical protein
MSDPDPKTPNPNKGISGLWDSIAGKPVHKVDSVEGSRTGMWDTHYADTDRNTVYDDPKTADMAAAFLNQPDIVTVEDWGCGYGGFKAHLADHQTYIGVDGSKTQAATKIVDLEKYTSTPDAVHLRHVLEHNPNWEPILVNALKSFQERMVLTLFTPFKGRTQVLNEYHNYNGTGITMVDIAFKRSDIVNHLESFNWTSEEGLATDSQYKVEHIFCLTR